MPKQSRSRDFRATSRSVQFSDQPVPSFLGLPLRHIGKGIEFAPFLAHTEPREFAKPYRPPAQHLHFSHLRWGHSSLLKLTWDGVAGIRYAVLQRARTGLEAGAAAFRAIGDGVSLADRHRLAAIATPEFAAFPGNFA